MPFMFGRNKKASQSTLAYSGMELGRAESIFHSGYRTQFGTGEANSNIRKKGMARLPFEMTPQRQYRDDPIPNRPTTSRTMTPGDRRTIQVMRGFDTRWPRRKGR
jgi:hypothetical protein